MAVVEILENLAFLANASNLVLYLTKFMHLSPSRSANTVTDFMGTAFLLTLLGGFLSDAFFTTYCIYLMSAVVEFLGLIILTIQAHLSSLKPPPCDPTNPISCQEVSGAKAAMLFSGLYLVALGVGGIKGSLPSHGAEQFDGGTTEGRKMRSTLQLLRLLPLVRRTHRGDFRGLGRGQQGLAVGVIIAAVINSINRSPSNAVANMATSPNNPIQSKPTQTDHHQQIQHQQIPSNTLKFLNNALSTKPSSSHKNLFHCTPIQVEEVKVVLKVLPIFISTIMLNCCLAQLSTFSVQQAATMDTKVGRLTVPPASLPIFPVVFIMLLAPLYDHAIIPFARKATKTESGVTHLQRIGIGLVLSIVAMAVAALVEVKRKRVATHSGMLDSESPLPITFFWVALQYLFLGSADLFTLAGLLEFFFTEAPASMRSLATSLSFASLAMGYYLSSVLVSVVNRVTSHSGRAGWLEGPNLNRYRLERFYWVMCVMSALFVPLRTGNAGC
ncbi:Nitrate transporter 1.2 [Acorus calamus]|uniref:Nitrate transporter 1.2 n=1 Tax=Acorus calamus TaxID=4465 RepID=A0AAV9BXU6_ACOCL|nr:Nitrate transporter 1.2 [Acorus calamus]